MNDCPNRLISFDELPEKVQNAYLNNWKRYIYPEDPEFIVNLDSVRYSIEYENTAITGVRPGAQNFKIGEKTFHLPWDENKEGKPYVMFKEKLYIRYARNYDEMNVDTISQLYELQYKEFDLTNEL